MAGPITAGNIQINDSSTATNNFTLKTDNAGGLKLARGNYGGTTQDVLSVDSAGRVAMPQGPAARTDTVSMVRLNTANGYGSTNTKIRRFTNVVTNQGSDITYADSATLGASFTINTAGVYAISYNDQCNAASFFGASLNSSQLTTNINAITVADVLFIATGPLADQPGCASGSFYLPSGSVVRAHGLGTPSGANTTAVQFTITRVS